MIVTIEIDDIGKKNIISNSNRSITVSQCPTKKMNTNTIVFLHTFKSKKYSYEVNNISVVDRGIINTN